jgi:O-antigen/teichoic acid export membrane protein
MIKEMCGDDKAGIYSFTFSISQLMHIFINAINSAITPWIYENLRKREYQAIAKTSNGLCLLIGVMTLGVMLVSPEIVRIMGTADYMEAIWIIPAVTLSVYFTFVYGFFANVEFYHSATRFVMVASVVAAVVKIAANALLISVFGYLAAGYTTLGCYILLAVMHYCFMCRICRKETNGQKVYDIRSLLLLSLGMIGLMLVCLVLYNNMLIRYAAIAMALAALFIYRNRVIGIIKQVV